MIYKSSTLLSIFKRKGGEGLFTKVISKDNLPKYHELFYNYFEDEVPIIAQYTDENYWIIFTNRRLILCESSIITYIGFETINKVSAPVFREAMMGIRDVNGFSLIELQTKDKQKYTLKTECGLPYTGIFHMLQFLSNTNS